MPRSKSYAADIALVRDVGRADLQRDRKADRTGNRHGIGRISGGVSRDARNPICAKNAADLLRVEPRFSGGQRRCDDPARRGEIGLEGVRPRRRRFHQKLLIAPVVHAVQKAGDRAVRGFVSGDTRFGKKLPRRPRGMLAEPGGDHIAAAQF